MSLRSLRLFTFILFSFIVFSATAQSPNIKWGEAIPSSAGNSLLNYLGEIDGHHFVLSGISNQSGYERATGWQGSGKSRLVSLQQFDASYQLTAEYPIETRQQGGTLNLDYGLLRDGKVILFYSEVDREANLFTVYRQTQAPFAWESEAALQEIATFPLQGPRPTLRFASNAETGDSYLYYPFDRLFSGTKHLAVIQLNAQFQANWTSEINWPESWRNVATTDHLVDPSGQLHLLAAHQVRTEKPRPDSVMRFAHSILTIASATQAPQIQRLADEGMILMDLQMEWSAGEKLAVAGLYRERRRWGAGGTYFQGLAATEDAVEPKLVPFEVDHVKEGRGMRAQTRIATRAAEGRPVTMPNLTVRDLIPRNDGGYFLTAEEFSIDEVNIDPTDFANPAPLCTIDQYNYENISVFALSATGEVEWSAKVRKQQTSTDNGRYSSFASFYDGQDLHLLFNDHKSNQNLSGRTFPRNFSVSKKRGALVLATISDAGAVEVRQLARYMDIQTIAQPRLCVQKADNELLLYGKARRTTQLGVLVAP